MTYVVVTLVPIVITALNIGVAMVDLHGLNTLVRLAIACGDVIVMGL